MDIFIVVPELDLFVGTTDRWPKRASVAACLVTAAGMAASIGANIGHVHVTWTDRLTAAVPSGATASMLAFGLLALK